MKLFAIATMVLMLTVGLFFEQHPAQAWWNTTAVNVYGWATVPRDGLQAGHPASYVILYDSWGNQVGSCRCSLSGRWYVNGVLVNGNYRAVAWAPVSSGWKSATTWKYVSKPATIPFDVGFPNLSISYW